MTQLDVRTIHPRDRHPLIFSVFGKLQLGESFELVNDHSPKPLHYQFLHEHPDRFMWEELETGPEIWRIRITRTAKESGQ